MLALARFHEAMGRCSTVPPWLFQSGLLGREETSQPNPMTEPFRSAKPIGISKVRTGSACAVFRVAVYRRRAARRSDRDRGCSFFCGWSIAGCRQLSGQLSQLFHDLRMQRAGVVEAPGKGNPIRVDDADLCAADDCRLAGQEAG